MGSPYENGIAFSYMTDPMAGSQMPSMLEENLAAAEVMRVYQDRIVIERRDMLRNQSLGPDLSFVPGGSEPTPDPAARPVLGAGEIAQEVIDGTNRAGTPTRQVKVTFPVARSTKTTPRAYCYAVRAWTEGQQFIQQKIVYSQAAMYSEKMDNSTAYCLFSTAELGGWRGLRRRTGEGSCQVRAHADPAIRRSTRWPVWRSKVCNSDNPAGSPSSPECRLFAIIPA